MRRTRTHHLRRRASPRIWPNPATATYPKCRRRRLPPRRRRRRRRRRTEAPNRWAWPLRRIRASPWPVRRRRRPSRTRTPWLSRCWQRRRRRRCQRFRSSVRRRRAKVRRASWVASRRRPVVLNSIRWTLTKASSATSTSSWLVSSIWQPSRDRSSRGGRPNSRTRSSPRLRSKNAFPK